MRFRLSSSTDCITDTMLALTRARELGGIREIWSVQVNRRAENNFPCLSTTATLKATVGASREL